MRGLTQSRKLKASSLYPMCRCSWRKRPFLETDVPLNPSTHTYTHIQTQCRCIGCIIALWDFSEPSQSYARILVKVFLWVLLGHYLDTYFTFHKFTRVHDVLITCCDKWFLFDILLRSRGSNPDGCQETFSSPHPSSPVLGPTQSPAQRITTLFRRVERPESRGSTVGWDTALQVGRSRVRFPMVSLEFFIDIILPAAIWPWG